MDELRKFSAAAAAFFGLNLSTAAIIVASIGLIVLFWPQLAPWLKGLLSRIRMPAGPATLSVAVAPSDEHCTCDDLDEAKRDYQAIAKHVPDRAESIAAEIGAQLVKGMYDHGHA